MAFVFYYAKVVKEIGILYAAYPDLRSALAEILKYIPYGYSEEMATGFCRRRLTRVQ